MISCRIYRRNFKVQTLRLDVIEGCLYKSRIFSVANTAVSSANMPIIVVGVLLYRMSIICEGLSILPCSICIVAAGCVIY